MTSVSRPTETILPSFSEREGVVIMSGEWVRKKLSSIYLLQSILYPVIFPGGSTG